MIEVFEHTADVGLRVHAADLNELFAEAGRGLFSLIVEDLAAVRPDTRVTIELKADRLDDLLFDWLSELLYRFEVRRVVLSHFQVQLDSMTSSSLHATCFGEPLAAGRHVLAHEVKAVTYHGLTVRQAADGWLAEVILDI